MRGVRRLLTVTALTAVFLANVSVAAAAAGVTISVDSAWITNANQHSFHVYGSADTGAAVDLTISDGVHTLNPTTTAGPGDAWSLNVDVSSLDDEASVSLAAYCGTCSTQTASTSATKDTTTVAILAAPDVITPTDKSISGNAENGDTVSIDVTDGSLHVTDSMVTTDGTWAFNSLDMASLSHDPTTITITVSASDGHSTATDSATAVKRWTPAVPSAPTAMTAAPLSGKVDVTWSAVDNGGSALTHYQVVSFNGGSAGPTCTVGGSTTNCTVSGLTNGTTYTFKVKAENAQGYSALSPASGEAVPSTYPAKPNTPTTVHHDGYVAVSWTPPDAGGLTIDHYTVSWTWSGGGNSQTCPSSPCDVNGLTNGTLYHFKVSAHNANGDGPDSDPSDATPSRQPSAPDAPGVTPANQQVTVTWNAPDTGGDPIDHYTVAWSWDGGASNGSMTCTVSTNCPGRSLDVIGLTNGTAYTFTITAHNVNGDGAASPGAVAVPFTVPDKPAAPTVVHHDTYLTVSWTPPNDEGRSIDSYTIAWTWSGGNSSQTCTSSPCDITALTNGTAYTVTVRAHNLAGDGQASDGTVATPSKAPAKPAAPTGVRGNLQVPIAWTAPDNGGDPITQYTIKWYWTGGNGSTTCLVGSTCGGSDPDFTYTVTGLTNGTAYTFTVTAYNVANGDGPESDASAPVTPRSQVEPSAPLSVTAIGLDQSARVSWSAPTDDGGSAITSYTVYSFDHNLADTGIHCIITAPFTNGLTCTFAGTPFTNFDGYKFAVTATNNTGESVQSAKTPYTNPRPGNSYVPVIPNRITNNLLPLNGLPGSSHSKTFPVTGRVPSDPTRNIPLEAVAVTGILSVKSPQNGGFLALTPTGSGNVSTLNMPKGDSRTTGVTIPLSPDVGGVKSLNVAYETVGSANYSAVVNFDVTGYFVVGTGGSTYYTHDATRILNTRDTPPKLQLTSGTPVVFDVLAGTQTGAEVTPPSGTITAVTGNLTITGQRYGGSLTIGPAGASFADTVTVMAPARDDRATGITVKVGETVDGDTTNYGKLSVTWLGTGGAHAIFDINGYFTTDKGGSMYVPVTPNRILDTRAKNGLVGAIGSPRMLHIYTNRCIYFNVFNQKLTDPTMNVPSGANAVTGILTVVGQTYNGWYALLWESTTTAPRTSTLNFTMDTRATGVTVPLAHDESGKLFLWYASIRSGRADVLFDVSGYFLPIP